MAQGKGRDILWVKTVCGHVWEATIAAVEEWSEIIEGFFADMILQIVGNSSRLISWTGKIVAEAARARNPSYLWFDGLSPANRSNVRTSAREFRRELRCLLAIV